MLSLSVVQTKKHKKLAIFEERDERAGKTCQNLLFYYRVIQAISIFFQFVL
jgi:hypothetical protein